MPCCGSSSLIEPGLRRSGALAARWRSPSSRRRLPDLRRATLAGEYGYPQPGRLPAPGTLFPSRAHRPAGDRAVAPRAPARYALLAGVIVVNLLLMQRTVTRYYADGWSGFSAALPFSRVRMTRIATLPQLVADGDHGARRRACPDCLLSVVHGAVSLLWGGVGHGRATMSALAHIRRGHGCAGGRCGRPDQDKELTGMKPKNTICLWFNKDAQMRRASTQRRSPTAK